MKFKDKFLEFIQYGPQNTLEEFFITAWVFACIVLIAITFCALVVNFGPIVFACIPISIFIAFPMYVYFKDDV